MNGFLVVDKKKDLSSFDVIRILKRICKFRKIGYIGTLDRNATGVLPIAINEGVKLIPFIENGKKVYRGRFLLGMKTDTFDIKGRVIEKVEVEAFEEKVVEEHLKKFEGRIKHQIPIFSAKKVNGKPLYKWAKEGRKIESPLKEVEIYEIKLLKYEHPFVDVEIFCSKGTYVRSIAHEFGLSLGVGAVLYDLRRTKQGEFTEEKAVSLEELKTVEDIKRSMIGLEEVLSSLKRVKIEKNLERFIRHGMPYPIYGSKADWQEGELVKFVDTNGLMIGIGMVDMKSGVIRVKRLINKEDLEKTKK